MGDMSMCGGWYERCVRTVNDSDKFSSDRCGCTVIKRWWCMAPATIYYRCSVIILPPRGHAPVRAIDMYRDGLRDTFLLRHVHTVLLLPASVCRLFQMTPWPNEWTRDESEHIRWHDLMSSFIWFSSSIMWRNFALMVDWSSFLLPLCLRSNMSTMLCSSLGGSRLKCFVVESDIFDCHGCSGALTSIASAS